MKNLTLEQSRTVEKDTYITYEEYLSLAEENRIVEWVDGEVIYYMPPFYKHQVIISLLDRILGDFVSILQIGEVMIAPFEVKLWPDGPSREPDLLFIRKENLENLTEKRFEGGPDLVVEVVSADSVRRDRVDKFQEYEQAGIQEYWIVDPRPNRQQADFYFRDEDGLFVPAEIDEDGVFRSAVLSSFWFNVNWFWEEPLPNPLLLLSRILREVEGISADLPEENRVLFEALTSNRNSEDV